MNARTLKEQHHQVRDGQPEALRMRIHRAISWLARAEQEKEDLDACYIFLWIAFNAAYASEFGFEQKECEQVRQFTGPIRTLIENRFVFEPF